MKRLTAILLVIALIISACAAPAGAGGSESGEPGSQTEEAFTSSEETGRQSEEIGQQSEGTSFQNEKETAQQTEEESSLLGEEGFVPAEEPKEEAAEEPAAEELHEVSEESDDSEPDIIESDTMQETEESKPRLVILEENGDDYRSAAGLKTSDIDKKTSQLHAVTNGSGGSNTSGKTGGKTAAKPVKDYTVMVYIVGSNLESRLGAATNDIAEMKQAGIDFGKTNLLVCTGGSRRWVSDISNKFNSVLDLSAERGSQIIAQTQESADMGMPQTLTEFINYCVAFYPAKHYGLIFWDHGAGPLWGYGSDELFGNDSLLLAEQRRAMDATVFGPQRKLDWVGFDACLMGNLETAKLWKDYARYLVASEELEPGRGWDYTCLDILNRTNDAREIASRIVDAYGQYYEKNRTPFFNPDVTLAALDLGKMDDCLAAADMFFDSLNGSIENGGYTLINQARSRTKAFGLSAAGSREKAYDLLDLKDFAQKAEEEPAQQPTAAPAGTGEKLVEAVDSLVVRSTGNVEGAGGVSFYMPGDNKELFMMAQELYTEQDILSDSYKDFTDSYTGNWLEKSTTDWKLPAPQKKNGELTLQLTPEQAKNASEVFYSILFRNGYGGYQAATCNVKITPDKDNTVHIPQDPLLVTAGTDLEDSAKPWAFTQVSDKRTESVYKTVKAVLSSGHEIALYDVAGEEEVSVSIRHRKGNTDTSILDITSAGGSVRLSGKSSIDVSGYRSIFDVGGDTLSPLRDENGQMKPYSEWEYKGYIYSGMAMDNSFRFYLKPVSEFNRKFICQVTVKDINGRLHGSEYVELNPGKKTQTEAVGTDKGKLYFDIKEDHAEVSDYEGTDEELVIPDTVTGKPVTVIAASAFSGAENVRKITLPDSVTEIARSAFYGTKTLRQISLPAGLQTIGISAFRESGIEEIELPEGLKKIGRAAFMESALKRVELPASLEEIGEIPFALCAQLTEIAVSDGNPNYKAVDGALYTKDGKQLIQYPNGKSGLFEVEEGTEVIRYGACARADISQVTFPESLLRIDNEAFYECRALEELQLPESLEYIGNLAFGSSRYWLDEAPEKQPHIDRIRIGANVSYIGIDAFTALMAGAFEVDEENPVYASHGGFITNTAGDTINTVPMGIGNMVVIPDGVTTLQSSLFTLLDPDAEFFIPDSVFRFSRDVFPYGRETSKETTNLENYYRCTIHCSEESAAWQYAERFGIRHDSNTDPDSMKYEEATLKDGPRTYYWRVFRDRAELSGFTQDLADKSDTLEVPGEYEGLPVTALRYEGDDAKSKYSGSISRIILPASVTEVDREFFVPYWNLANVEAAPENTEFAGVEGVLFTKDMKTLIFYPYMKKDSEYRVPDGVEELGENAFAMNRNLQKVAMPSSLRVIGKSCFMLCSKLKEVDFSEGLTEIRDLAFGYVYAENMTIPSSVEWIGNSVITLHDKYGELVIPENLRKTGYTAFAADYGKTFSQKVIRIPAKLQMISPLLGRVLFESYEVDPSNPYYKEEDGILMSRDGKTLVSVPTLRKGELHIPEGTMYIRFSALNECDLITDIYLPDSILDLGNIGVKDNKTGKYKYTIHCHEGSEPQKKLEAKEVPWVPIGD